MALDPRDITLLSQLLDQALELTPAERVAWLAALPAEHQRHAEALRAMLAREATLDTDDRLAAMPSPVSYTHLDVYKRQMRVSRSLKRAESGRRTVER